MDEGGVVVSVAIIQQRLKQYSCRNDLEELQAMREISQEVALAALGRGDFFKSAVFQGGTCLRIFHGLNRFSEDLDFVLREPNPDFSLTNAVSSIQAEMSAFGYEIEILDRSKSEHAVKQMFLKDSSLGKLLRISYLGKNGPIPEIRIKLEVDTNPPKGSRTEMKYLDFPFISSVHIQDLPSLFSGKIHALLCRGFVKGRDWYDFLWYTAMGVAVNVPLLESSLLQAGPWKGQPLEVDLPWLVERFREKIDTIDWDYAREDVRRFVPVVDYPSLDHWGSVLFSAQVDKLYKTLSEKGMQ